MDFLFHKVSEKEKEEIKKQAKEILDNFSKQLSKVDKKVGDALVERDKCSRVEGERICEEFDRKIMFDNAPNKDEDFFVTEKGKW